MWSTLQQRRVFSVVISRVGRTFKHINLAGSGKIICLVRPAKQHPLHSLGGFQPGQGVALRGAGCCCLLYQLLGSMSCCCGNACCCCASIVAEEILSWPVTTLRIWSKFMLSRRSQTCKLNIEFAITIVDSSLLQRLCSCDRSRVKFLQQLEYIVSSAYPGMPSEKGLVQIYRLFK